MNFLGFVTVYLGNKKTLIGSIKINGKNWYTGRNPTDTRGNIVWLTAERALTNEIDLKTRKGTGKEKYVITVGTKTR
jgi:hypothetical protein